LTSPTVSYSAAIVHFFFEAGGGEDYLQTGNIIAGNPSIHRYLLQEIREVVDGEVSR